MRNLSQLPHTKLIKKRMANCPCTMRLMLFVFVVSVVVLNVIYIYIYIYIYNAPFCSKNVQTHVHFRSENAALWDMGLFYSGRCTKCDDTGQFHFVIE